MVVTQSCGRKVGHRGPCKGPKMEMDLSMDESGTVLKNIVHTQISMEGAMGYKQ